MSPWSHRSTRARVLSGPSSSDFKFWLGLRADLADAWHLRQANEADECTHDRDSSAEPECKRKAVVEASEQILMAVRMGTDKSRSGGNCDGRKDRYTQRPSDLLGRGYQS